MVEHSFWKSLGLGYLQQDTILVPKKEKEMLVYMVLVYNKTGRVVFGKFKAGWMYRINVLLSHSLVVQVG